MSEHVAIVGAGVIGAAWAARFVMHGIDVKISDPNPEAGRIVDEVLDNARAAWVDLGLPDPTEGSVSVVGSIAEAVEGAIHVQESVPENLAIKVPILEQIAAACPSDTVIASSTSGIKPSISSPRSPTRSGWLSAIRTTRCTLAGRRGRRWRPHLAGRDRRSDGDLRPGVDEADPRPGRDRRLHRRSSSRGGVARGALARERRCRHHPGDRRCHAVRLRSSVAQMGLSRRTASQAARAASVTSSVSSVRRCRGRGPN